MAKPELPIPDHYDPATVGEVRRVRYQELGERALHWSREHGMTTAADDRPRLCLMIVDDQNTFCIPGFELFVAGRSGRGAVDDNVRLCRFIYRNLASITEIAATLDTHTSMQVFHSLFLVDEHGNHPPPMTAIGLDEIEQGKWRINPQVPPALRSGKEWSKEHLLHYCRTLARRGKYQLMIWPYHAMLGGIGHALVSSVEEAIFFHGIARHSRTSFEIKGGNPWTEHYSALGPEVLEGPDGRPIGGKNTAFLERLLRFDAVAIAGQAKSHCLAWTIDDLLSAVGPEQAGKVYLLEDCTSPVVVPGVVDFTEQADEAFARFQRAGMHVVRSTDPIASWPGIGL
jgi:nicotinamidase-related amidase